MDSGDRVTQEQLPTIPFLNILVPKPKFGNKKVYKAKSYCYPHAQSDKVLAAIAALIMLKK